MSDDIRAKAQAVLDYHRGLPLVKPLGYASELAQHVLATEARLDVALRGALQSREEMREWLGSGEVRDLVTNVVFDNYDPEDTSSKQMAALVLAALIAAMPGGDA